MTQTNEPKLPDVFAGIDRDRFLEEVAALVDDEVKSQSGVAGFAIRGAYRIALGLRPAFVEEALRQLFPAFAARLDPILAAKQEHQSHEELFDAEQAQVAAALLSVTDGRAQAIRIRALRAAYQKVRGHADKSVRRAAPGLGRILDRHIR